MTPVISRTVTRSPPKLVVRVALIVGYGAVLFVPLALMTGVMKAGDQARLVVFADGLGFAALSALALQILVSGRWAATTRSFGLRSVLSLHRQAGVAVLALVVLHVLVLLIADPSRLALFDPRSDPARARAGILALLGLLGLAGTSIWRRRLGLSYAATALFWTRVARPYATALKPYRVLAVRKEQGDAVTLELAADGHRGLRFEPGQFARIRGAHCLYGMDEHPFSLSSSALRPDRPSFTIKALGDFSASVAELRVGAEVLIDGPHGESAHDAPGVRGRLLLAAGIGIAPALSVIRTAAERGDDRPLLLLYGSRRWTDVTFGSELRELQQRLPNLRVVHVLSRPDPTWRGERGRVGEQLLRRHAPADVVHWNALVCGPAAMVTESAAALERLGLPPSAIQAESSE